MSRRRRTPAPPRCPDCDAPIEWVTDSTGQRRPLDYGRVTVGRRWQLAPRSTIAVQVDDLGAEGRTDHRDTCGAIAHPSPPPDPRLPAGDR